MKLLSVLLYHGVLRPISFLPYRVLYGFSDVLFLLMYHVIGYRRKVVLRNIANSFPEKSTQEHEQIALAFYRHFCDVIMESFKVFSITEKEVQERMVFENPELLNSYFEKNRSVIIAGGHYNNWELFAVAVDAPMKHQAIAIYKKLKNDYLDKKMRESRGKYGLSMISTKIVKEVFDQEKENLTATIFAIDQSPSSKHKCYWTTFLNQETDVVFGAERYAKEYNYPVLFGHIEKLKRGYYRFRFTPVEDNPRQSPHGEIMEKLTQVLEKDIKEQPQYWLWTHRRWKRIRPEGIPLGQA
jgi:KDO2-lipid IV(A) lauroyltransferase